MACYKPLTAYQCSDKSIIWREIPGADVVRTLSLPCGQCVGCRLERSRQWAVRCMHEAQMHTSNCFITLTYAPEHCPKDMSLHYEDFQLFMKRLRKRYTGKTIRFYMAGEYGESFDRPHFHACIFGLDFEDKKFFQRTQTGSILYDAEAHYQYCDLETGEIIQRTPEFNKMSLKPGIGQAWFDKYMSDVYTTDSVVVRGKKCRPPRFYDNKFKELFPEQFDDIQYKRELDGRSYAQDNTLERLAVKEKVALAKLSLLKRKI